jgi:DNA excision repair protein ERCC-3
VQVASRDIESIKQYCESANLPLIEEFDFRKDNQTPDLKIELKSTTMVRDYQEQSLSKMFSNGRARSGIIVLPCGAGKTLTGITAASHIKKSTLVLCSSNVSVAQWRQEFYRWANLHGSPVVAFTSKERGKMFEPS